MEQNPKTSRIKSNPNPIKKIILKDLSPTKVKTVYTNFYLKSYNSFHHAKMCMALLREH